MPLVSNISFSYYNYTQLSISTATFQDYRCCNKNHIIYVFNGQSTKFFTSQSYLFENNTNILFSVMFLFVGLIFQTVLFSHSQSVFLKFYSFWFVCTFPFVFCLVLSSFLSLFF